MKPIFTIFVSLLIGHQISAQNISKTDYKFLQKKEDSLKTIGLKIVQGRTAADRFTADSLFTRVLVRALKTPYSINFPFDSIINVSKIYPPDSSFRIYTWQLMINENTVRQHGAIQIRTKDGSFKRFALIDKSDVTNNMADTIGNNEGWMGAVYYKIIQKQWNGRTIYTLFGFDENNIRSDKKIMDVLEFVNGEPVFGSKIFVMENGSNYPKNASRFIMEFKKEASPRLTFDTDYDAVIFDELFSETGDIKKKYTLVPDGEYEGFKWTNGKWIHSKNIFGGAPPQKYIIPKPIRDTKGNIDDNQLKGGEKENP